MSFNRTFICFLCDVGGTQSSTALVVTLYSLPLRNLSILPIQIWLQKVSSQYGFAVLGTAQTLQAVNRLVSRLIRLMPTLVEE